MSMIGLVRRPSPALQTGERTHIERTPIDFAAAEEQHAAYVAALRESGVRIVEIAPAEDLPDAVFIEDMALVLDSLAVIARSGAASRRAESATITGTLARYRHLVQLPPAACLDGGDVLAIDRTVYIGRTTRTNQAAIDFLTTLLRQYYYEVVTVPVSGCLHLKSAVTWIGNNTVLINPEWVPRAPFSQHRQIDIAPEEPMAANALHVGTQLLMSASYPRTAARVGALGLVPRLIDISEFHRTEGGLTCLSILVNTPDPS